ncbi:MAG: CPBP family intramembrane metalloprotease [Oscillospiraceae bacterium]|nr:CPBP family intramembrane metalloprotease [Oscillospiraceae bacterium]
MKALTKERIKKPLLCGVAFSFILIVPVILMMFATIIGMLVVDENYEVSDNLIFIFTELGMLSASVIACSFVKKRHGTKLRETVKVKDFDLAVPIMLMIFGWSTGEIIDHCTGLILSNFMVVEPNVNEITIISFISAVICAPIFEELICRFGWCELARGAYSLPIICIANGIFFSLPHMYNIQGFINVFIGGLCSAYVYCKTRNILYVIIRHAIHNVFALGFDSLKIIFGEFATYENGFVQYSWQYLAVNAVLVIISVIYFVKVFRKKYTENYFEINRETGLAITE